MEVHQITKEDILKVKLLQDIFAEKFYGDQIDIFIQSVNEGFHSGVKDLEKYFIKEHSKLREQQMGLKCIYYIFSLFFSIEKSKKSIKAKEELIFKIYNNFRHLYPMYHDAVDDIRYVDIFRYGLAMFGIKLLLDKKTEEGKDAVFSFALYKYAGEFVPILDKKIEAEKQGLDLLFQKLNKKIAVKQAVNKNEILESPLLNKIFSSKRYKDYTDEFCRLINKGSKYDAKDVLYHLTEAYCYFDKTNQQLRSCMYNLAFVYYKHHPENWSCEEREACLRFVMINHHFYEFYPDYDFEIDNIDHLYLSDIDYIVLSIKLLQKNISESLKESIAYSVFLFAKYHEKFPNTIESSMKILKKKYKKFLA